LESTIVKGGMKIGESLGFLAVKFHGGPYFPRGFPDVGFFKDGGVRFVEYKRPGEEPSEIQKVWHRRLRDLGFAVAVIDRAADTRVFLEGLQ
jgi:hypothetical protein